MFIFGHAGITLGAAILLAGVLKKNNVKWSPRGSKLKEMPHATPGPPSSQSGPDTGIVSAYKYLAERVDIRILLVGSLLPDIIDKPIGEYFFRQTFGNGQIYAHTLLFLMVISAAGLILYRNLHKTWLLALASGTFTHIILDGMWRTPRTLLWPLFGFSFEKYSTSFWSWIELVIHHVTREPWVLVPEIAGLIVFAWFIWQVTRSGKLRTFLKCGKA